MVVLGDTIGYCSRIPCVQRWKRTGLLLLGLLNDELDLGDLGDHGNVGTLEDGNARETLALIEGLNDEGTSGSELNFAHITLLDEFRGLNLLATGGLLAGLPVDGGEAEGAAGGTAVTDGGVADLDLSGVVEDHGLGGEVLAGADGVVTLLDHDVTAGRHVSLGETLHVDADVVAGASVVVLLVVHLDGEDLTLALVGGSMSGEEDDLITLGDLSLLDAHREHVTDALDVKAVGNGGAEGSGEVTDGKVDHLVEGIEEADDLDGLASGGP